MQKPIDHIELLIENLGAVKICILFTNDFRLIYFFSHTKEKANFTVTCPPLILIMSWFIILFVQSNSPLNVYYGSKIRFILYW